MDCIFTFTFSTFQSNATLFPLHSGCIYLVSAIPENLCCSMFLSSLVNAQVSGFVFHFHAGGCKVESHSDFNLPFLEAEHEAEHLFLRIFAILVSSAEFVFFLFCCAFKFLKFPT